MRVQVAAVSRSKRHGFSKLNEESINLIAGIGVEGDAHAGKTVQHVYLAKKDPTRKNLLQVHLIAEEVLFDLEGKGFEVAPGELGENVTTSGIDLLSLPKGTKLHLGESAVIELTALRNPCPQIDKFKKGLVKEVVSKDEHGNVILKLGVMSIVLVGGMVRPKDEIVVELPQEPHQKLEYTW